jgi:hypothetical protein
MSFEATDFTFTGVSGGFIGANTSVRAPIFYDSPDTSWFLDPSSTSVLNIVRANAIEHVNGTDAIQLTDGSYLYFRSPDNGIRLYLGGADPANYYDNNTHYFRNRASTILAELTTADGFKVGPNTSGQYTRFGGNGGATDMCTVSASNGNLHIDAKAANNLYLSWYNTATTYVGGEIAATVFRDRDNAAYYVDPTGTSNLVGLTVNGSAVYRSDWTTRFQSPSDFVDGTLVTTDIPATGWAGDSFVIEITGKSYDQNNPPFKVVAQGYLYNDTIINYSGISYAGNFATYIKVFQDGGVLKFWWPRISYWNSFNVNVMAMDGATDNTITRNRVTAIGNSTEPTGTKKQQINLTKTLKTGDAAGSISGFNNPTTAPTANTIVYRDGLGDISAREIVLSSGLSTVTPTVLVSMYPTTNQMVRTTPAAVAASLQSSIQSAASGTWGISVTGNAATSNGLQTRYDGGQRLNPQDYFGQGLGLRVAMTAAAGVWSDTLWINGYSGGDVLNMCALHTSRQATPRMWISSQASNGTSYGTLYEFPSLGYNSGNTAGLYAGVYYDSPNTAYYLDPAGNSVLGTASFGETTGSNTGISVISSTGGYGRVRYFEGGTNQHTIHFFSSGWQSGDIGTSGNSINIGANGAVTMGPWNVPWEIVGPSYAQHTTTYRAPIFRDSNNTAYYVDPDGTSNIYQLTGAITYGSYGSMSISGQTNNYAGIAFPTKSSTLMMGDGGATPAGFYFGNSAWGMYCYSNGGIYTHIMYDLDNSAYRVDPTGTSALSTVTFGSNHTTGGGGGRIIPSTGSPYSLRQEFGSDNSGWRYGIAKNVSGAVTVLFYVQDNGDCVATGNITAYSDIRIKANVETIPNALDKIGQIRGVTYTRTDMDDKERRYAGVIAQEIEAVLPEAVGGDENAKTVDYNATIALLIEAVKELRDEVEALRK